MGKLYLDLTYSGSATIIRAIRPPSGVIPFRSPIPSWLSACSTHDAFAAATHNRGVDVGRTGLERGVGVGNGASRVVVEMRLNVAADSVSDTDSVDTDLVDGSVDGQEVDQLGSERVF